MTRHSALLSLLLLLLLSLPLCSHGRKTPVRPRSCGGLPRHVHLAVGADAATEMTVSFASIPSKFDAPIGGVMIGTSPTKLDRVVLEQEPPSSYQLKITKSYGANYGDHYYSPYYHHVQVKGLEPATTYYYRPVVHARVEDFGLRGSQYNRNSTFTKEEAMERIEDLERQEVLLPDHHRRELGRLPPYDGTGKACPSADKIRSFRTAPLPGSPINIAFMGDLGQYDHSQETLSGMMRAQRNIDTVILAGDIAYASNDPRQWDTFFDFMDDFPVAERFGMQIVPGNHDIDKLTDDSQIFLAYEHRFRMPRVKPAQLGVYDGPLGSLDMDKPPYPLPYEWGNAYYAYTYGPARMIMVSSYSAMDTNSTQYKWIEQELKSVDRSATPWVLVVLHTPLYNTFSLHQKDPQIAAAKEYLEPLFVKYHVNMIFSGHIHAYLRTQTVKGGDVHPTGPMHVTIGAGGRKCEAPFLSEEPEAWVAVRDATIYGYGMLHIHNATHAEWDWIHTGYNEERNYNEIKHSNITLPSVSKDRVLVENQFFVEA